MVFSLFEVHVITSIYWMSNTCTICKVCTPGTVWEWQNNIFHTTWWNFWPNDIQTQHSGYPGFTILYGIELNFWILFDGYFLQSVIILMFPCHPGQLGKTSHLGWGSSGQTLEKSHRDDGESKKSVQGKKVLVYFHYHTWKRFLLFLL